MTTKPRAKKFRLRRGGSGATTSSEASQPQAYANEDGLGGGDMPFAETHDDGFGSMDFTGDEASKPKRAVSPRRPSRGSAELQANPAQAGGRRPRAAVV